MSFLCAVPLVASLISGCAADAALAVGYVEGEYVLLAPTEIARVEAVLVERGDHVDAGEPVALTQKRDAELAVAQAEAALAEATAELADLKQGKRPEEINVIEATLASAEAARKQAERVLGRTEDLNQRGIATDAELDDARTSLETAAAAVREAEANLAVAGLPARPETIEAAEKRREQAEAALEEAKWRLSERTIRADAPGRITDLVRTAGDVAGPQAPVISMLPEGAVKLKLYVPEETLSSIAVGTRLAVRCDGCPPDLFAEISYIAPEPEFTPPVIYSPETRQKLVHLVEARPAEEAKALQPGQIVDVRIADEAGS